MAEILGKVAGSASYEVPRGADVALQVKVPLLWLTEGRTIEIELPRNLECARCSGGGCSACNNAGAITLRGRAELPEVVQVVLPLMRHAECTEAGLLQPRGGGAPESERAPDSEPRSARPVVIRIPECGGLPDAANGAIIRGWLLLEVRTAEAPSSNVRWLDDDDDPLSSSKMLRAEVRTASGQPMGGIFRGVTASRSIRAPMRPVDDAAEPPSSRVAKVGSTAPPDAPLGSPAAAPLLTAPERDNVMRRGSEPSGLASRAGARLDKNAAVVYVGLVVLAVIGVLALIFF